MRSATAEINLTALEHNVAQIREIAPHSKIMAVVKANAYGHGLLGVARALKNVDAFAVARVEEALTLRSGGVVKPILLLEGFFSTEELPILVANNIHTSVHIEQQLAELEEAELETPINVWLKMDTGMHRLGIRPEQCKEAINRLKHNPNVVQPARLMTHFGCADERDNPITQKQIDIFDDLTEGIEGEQSIANSAGVIAWPSSRRDWIRPGISLYGVSPMLDNTATEHNLKPVMTLTTDLIAIHEVKQDEIIGYGGIWRAPKDTQIGVVAIGYGDGYPRMAPEGTPVLVNGRIVPVVGRVSMDMLTVDLGADCTDNVGDKVILWGEGLAAELVAEHIGTIAYELVTKLTQRVSLKYLSQK